MNCLSKWLPAVWSVLKARSRYIYVTFGAICETSYRSFRCDCGSSWWVTALWAFTPQRPRAETHSRRWEAYQNFPFVDRSVKFGLVWPARCLPYSCRCLLTWYLHHQATLRCLQAFLWCLLTSWCAAEVQFTGCNIRVKEIPFLWV